MIWNLYCRFYWRGLIWEIIVNNLHENFHVSVPLPPSKPTEVSVHHRSMYAELALILYLVDVSERFDGLCVSSRRWIHKVFGTIHSNQPGRASNRWIELLSWTPSKTAPAKFSFEDRFFSDTVWHYTSVSIGDHYCIAAAGGSLCGFA